MQTRSFLLLLALVLLVPLSSVAASSYRDVRVIDGDTFDATDGVIIFRVRIAGIDAPEKDAPFYKRAKQALQQRLADRAITLTPVGHGLDRYNRVLAHVSVGSKNIGVELITQGLATYYRPGCKDFAEGSGAKYDYDPRPYIAAEAAARNAKRRMWGGGAPRLPCEARGR